MRKLGFVLVAMLAMTLVGAAYAAPSTTGIDDDNTVNVKISVVESTSLTVDGDINIEILAPDKWFGVLSDLNVTTNSPVVVKLTEILLPDPDDNPWPDPYAFYLFIDDGNTNFGGQTEWTKGRDSLPGTLTPWAYVESGYFLIFSSADPEFLNTDSRTVLYAIGVADDELPEAGSEYTFQVVYQLTTVNLIP